MSTGTEDVDISTLSPEEQAHFRKYGALPKGADKFRRGRGGKRIFDSADYSMQMHKGKTGPGVPRGRTLAGAPPATGAGAPIAEGDEGGEDEEGEEGEAQE